ncbi:hypothetical protein [Archaeoglobus sp.]
MSDEDLLKELEEYRNIIRRVLDAFENVPFHIIIKVATDRDVERFDLSDAKDRSLVEELKLLADITMQHFYSNPITISRINEVSNYLEEQVPHMFLRNRSQFSVIKEVKHLGGSGYPDLIVVDNYDRYTYIDVKATQRPGTGSPRDFYITPLKETKRKVNHDGRHCVLGFVVSGTPNNFRIIGWKLVDLYNVKLRMKPEFNCSNLELYKSENILVENNI